jgi:hypothetical protein
MSAPRADAYPGRLPDALGWLRRHPWPADSLLALLLAGPRCFAADDPVSPWLDHADARSPLRNGQRMQQSSFIVVGKSRAPRPFQVPAQFPGKGVCERFGQRARGQPGGSGPAAISGTETGVFRHEEPRGRDRSPIHGSTWWATSQS